MTEKARFALVNDEWETYFIGVSAANGYPELRPITVADLPTAERPLLVYQITKWHWLSEILFPDYWANREVKRREKFEHLNGKTTSEQCGVIAAVYNGQVVKVDGHGRAAAWGAGRLTGGAVLKVSLNYCETIEEVHALYERLNGSLSHTNAADKVSHEIKKSEFKPKSGILQKDLITAVACGKYRAKYGGNDGLAKAFAELKDTLNIIDGWGRSFPKGSKKKNPLCYGMYCVGIKSAMIQSVEEYKPHLELVKQFWQDYHDNNPANKGAAALRKEVMEVKSFSGNGVHDGLCREALGKIELYLSKNGVDV